MAILTALLPSRWREGIGKESYWTYVYQTEKRGKRTEVGRRMKGPKRKLTGARVELAIYRFHDVRYETVALNENFIRPLFTTCNLEPRGIYLTN